MMDDGLISPEQGAQFVARLTGGLKLPRTGEECWPKKAQRWWWRLTCWVRGHDLGESFVAGIEDTNGIAVAYDRRVCARCSYWKEEARELWPVEIEQKIKELAESVHLADIGAQLGEAPDEALRELAAFILARGKA